MKFAILALLIIAVIGFFVIVWKAAKDWRWYQIVAAIFTMLMAVTFMFPVAGVLRSRSAWNKVYEELSTRLAESEEKQKKILNGDPSDPTAGEGVTVLNLKLSKLAIEAGRRWRNLQLQGVNNNAITLVRAAAPVDPLLQEDPADGAGAAAAAAALPLIPDGLVVYGFAEQPQPGLNVPVPTFFLGEFRVTASAPNQVTLAPLGKLEGPQQQAITSGQASSWSLYELLPLDGHEPFIADGSEADADFMFGRVDDELVNRVLGKRVSPETLKNYLRDGSRSTTDDPPMSRWVKIEFLKNHSFDVDSPEKRSALDGGFFDGNGRAVDSRLQRSEAGPLQFKSGVQIVVKEEAANVLRDEGVAKLVDTYYSRPLNDYRFVLRRIRLQLTELAIRQEELKYEEKVLQAAVDATVAMLTTNQTVKLNLELDLAQTQVEKKSISDYTDKLTATVNATRAELTRLYQSNQNLEQQLEQIHRTISNRLDAVTLAN